MRRRLSVGWIGLGKLGLPIAGRVAASGFPVFGHDRAADRLGMAAALGIEPSEVRGACSADVVFSSLPDDRALLEATAGDGGLLAAMREGAIFVETSTVGPEASAEVGRRAAERGVRYLRLPISGNASIAHTGNLTCFASGPREAFETAQPVLEKFTRAQLWLGEGEEARYAKLAVNLMLAVTAAMMGESLALARKGNIGWQQILDVLADSAAASPMVKYKVEPLAARDFSATFSCRQMAKDLDLILAAGHTHDIPMPLAALTRETYAALIGRGEGEQDFTATVRHIEMLAGLGEP
jgi:3-hydroxyisobutyrate dehydrogenase-like beta-hydroxyacid dehydrogenase